MINRIMNRQLGILLGVSTLAACALLTAVTAPAGPTASGHPLAQPTPTCPAPPAGCTVARRYGWQPYPSAMIGTFNDAARNGLGGNGPTYPQIARGVPVGYPGGSGITYRNVSTAEPIPSTILKAMGWWESGWRQFDGGYGANGCTYVSNTCDYGVMQLNQNSMGGMDSGRIAAEYRYNIGAGTRVLIGKWNWMSTPTYRLVAPNNHTLAEDWYYAVTAYNDWSDENDPHNDDDFPTRLPQRPPYRDTSQPGNEYWRYNYPYQEIVWGYMAHPGTYGGQLWSPLHAPWVPRGIWGTGQGWRPAEWTSRPTFYYLPDIRANSGSGNRNSYLITQNTQDSYTLAADVAFYNSYGTFTAWWLDAGDQPLRLDPRTIRILPAANAFSGRNAGLVCAGQDVAVVVNSHNSQSDSDGAPSYSYAGAVPQGHTLYLPSLHYQPTWNWYSEIVVQNAGPTAATFNLTFYTYGGEEERRLTGQTIQPAASRVYKTSSYCGSGYYGPAVVQVTSGGPLTAVVREWNTDGYGLDLAYHGLASGATRLYLPSQHRANWGWDSWVHVQNPNGFPVTVWIHYYDPSTGNQKHTDSKTINAYGTTYFWSGEPGYAPYLGNDYWGPAELTCTSPIVAICNEVRTDKALSYSAFTTAANHLALPAQAYEGDWNTWTFVQNPNGSSMNVYVHYWYLDENNDLHVCTKTLQNVKSHGSAYVAASDCLPSGKKGSAWVSAGQPVVVIVNQVGAKNKDQAMSYSGIPR